MNAQEFRQIQRDAVEWWGEMVFYPIWWAGFACFCAAVAAVPVFFVVMLAPNIGSIPEEALPFAAVLWLAAFVATGLFRARRRALGWVYNRLVFNDAGLEYVRHPQAPLFVSWPEVESAHVTLDDENDPIHLTLRTSRGRISLDSEDWGLVAIQMALSKWIPERTNWGERNERMASIDDGRSLAEDEIGHGPLAQHADHRGLRSHDHHQ
jgi:hypothetical protein